MTSSRGGPGPVPPGGRPRVAAALPRPRQVAVSGAVAEAAGALGRAGQPPNALALEAERSRDMYDVLAILPL